MYGFWHKYIHGNGHGNPVKSTGPPRPASASSKLIITAIAASSFPSVLAVWIGDSGIAEFAINPITSDSGPWDETKCVQSDALHNT